MEEVLHANIFFVITSVATVIFFVIVCFVMYQVYKVIKLVRSILERLESASEIIAQDVSDFRTSVKSGGFVGRILSFIMAATGKKSGRK